MLIYIDKGAYKLVKMNKLSKWRENMFIACP